MNSTHDDRGSEATLNEFCEPKVSHGGNKTVLDKSKLKRSADGWDLTDRITIWTPLKWGNRFSAFTHEGNIPSLNWGEKLQTPSLP